MFPSKLAACVLLFAATAALAAEPATPRLPDGKPDLNGTWDNGGGDGLWSTAANWSGDALPNAGDAVVFDNTSDADCAVDADVTVASLTVDPAYGGTITLQASRSLMTGPVSIGGGSFDAELAEAGLTLDKVVLLPPPAAGTRDLATAAPTATLEVPVGDDESCILLVEDASGAVSWVLPDTPRKGEGKSRALGAKASVRSPSSETIRWMRVALRDGSTSTSSPTRTIPDATVPQ